MSENTADTLIGVEGEVKWFDSRKGFGFIIGPNEQDVMVHYSVISGQGYRSLRDGMTVEYDAKRTESGWKATRVARLNSVETPKRHPSPRTPRQ